VEIPRNVDSLIGVILNLSFWRLTVIRWGNCGEALRPRSRECENAHTAISVWPGSLKKTWSRRMLPGRFNVRLNGEVPVLARVPNTTEPESSINRVRVSEGLDPYQAPSGKRQFIAAVALILSSLLLTLIL
jgi:hypothetical protein